MSDLKEHLKLGHKSYWCSNGVAECVICKRRFYEKRNNQKELEDGVSE